MNKIKIYFPTKHEYHKYMSIQRHVYNLHGSNYYNCKHVDFESSGTV